MNHVAHAITAHSETLAPLRQPDAFERTSYLVQQIDEAALAVVAQCVKLKASRVSGDAAGMRDAAAAIISLTGQNVAMCETIQRVIK